MSAHSRPTLAFQHGLGSSSSQALDLLAPLSGVSLIAADAPAHGESQALPGHYSFDAMADAILAALPEEEAPFILGGISMGAGISLNIACRHPALVRALVLVRPAWLADPNPPNLAIIARVGAWLEEGGPDLAHQRLLTDPEFAEIRDIHERSAASILGAIDSPGIEHRGRVFREMVGSSPIDAMTDLATLDVPALVLGTDLDPLHPANMAKQIAEALPGATYHDTPPRYAEPHAHAEEVRRLVAEFIDDLEEE